MKMCQMVKTICKIGFNILQILNEHSKILNMTFKILPNPVTVTGTISCGKISITAFVSSRSGTCRDSPTVDLRPVCLC